MSPNFKSYNKVTVAFYKGGNSLIHKIIKWWTGSEYSHAELILPDGVTWISISPFFNSKVTPKIKLKPVSTKDWDFIDLQFSHREAVRLYQNVQLYRFIEETQFSKYDWIGMLLSQCGPFIVKNRTKWYCSEWIAYALLHSRILTWDEVKIYSTPDMSPNKLYNLVKGYTPKHYK